MNRKERRLQARKSAKNPPAAKSLAVANKNGWKLSLTGGIYAGRFQAMASPCEILIDGTDRWTAEACVELASQEARRIEEKFSRYREDNIIFQINRSGGNAVPLDEETEKLLLYAGECFELSEGKFDITSGILRKAWKFDGSDRLPADDQIEQLLKNIGWPKVKLSPGEIRMPAGMEIDLGGIGKEYAVDRAALIVKGQTEAPFLVNFGGDLYASGPRRNGQAWSVGIEDPQNDYQSIKTLKVKAGGLATSGDARRFLLKDGKRFGHILDPATGWPVEDAPRSVSVAAASCTEAGVLSTLAQLQGKNAESFLQDQGVQYWCYR